MPMLDDLDVIIKKYPDDMNTLHVYGLGDVHVGSPEFDERSIRKKIQIIADDPCAAVCLCGDLGDYGLKNSKTNVYQATMSPHKEIVVDASLGPGGYGMKKEYEILPPPELQYLEIYMYREGHKSSLRRVVNYHSIQI